LEQCRRLLVLINAEIKTAVDQNDFSERNGPPQKLDYFYAEPATFLKISYSNIR